MSIQSILDETQDWYKQHSVEKIANLTTTSLELLLETSPEPDLQNPETEKTLVQAFNIILSQQILQQNVDEICILIQSEGAVHAVDNGQDLYDYVYKHKHISPDNQLHFQAINYYNKYRKVIQKNEQIYSLREGEQRFHVFVPLVPKGEYAGAVYLQISPDLSFISSQISSSYDETSLIFSAFILFGLMAMFYISAYSVRERDETQRLLYEEREKHLRDQMDRKKESLFTKRIYHTHHKAEKIMGFIKEDLRNITPTRLNEIKYRITKYANFISRVIYDMKWYDPPLQTIRNPMFKTELNEVLKFIVDNIFQRTSDQVKNISFELQLEDALPIVSVNEFVVWEIIEPLIQNSVEHTHKDQIKITLKTCYDKKLKQIRLQVKDNGDGVRPDLLEINDLGVKKMFLENISTKQGEQNSGYGCFLAHEICRRCGWQLDVDNCPPYGCCYTIIIPVH
jgi:anti-sigma regulatory factor (Ser/Thr protein kinase)